MRRISVVLAVVLTTGTLAGASHASGGKDHGNGDGKKVTICHVPPGNPSNAHTITVGAAAVPAHLAHGDYLGPCKKKKYW